MPPRRWRSRATRDAPAPAARWIARAGSYAASASAGLPVSRSSVPMLLWSAGQVALELGDGGVGVGQPLRGSPAPPRYAASASAGLPVSLSSSAEVVVAARQVALELGDGGVAPGQPLPDRPRRLVGRQRLGRLAGAREQDADVVVALARSLWYSVTVGFGVASRSGSPAPARTPPAPRPACRCRRAALPRLWWLPARSRWNSVTVGLARPAAAGSPAPPRTPPRLGRLAGVAEQHADVAVACRQVALVLGDGGVCASAAPDRQRRLVAPPAPRPACRCRRAGGRCCCGWRPGRSGTR